MALFLTILEGAQNYDRGTLKTYKSVCVSHLFSNYLGVDFEFILNLGIDFEFNNLKMKKIAGQHARLFFLI